MGLSVILVDYKSIEKTLKYIEQCHLYLRGKDIEYIIVDNNEEQYSQLYLKEKYELKKIKTKRENVYRFMLNNIQIIYIYIGKNIGYARGNNTGVEVSELLFDENNILISNNDIEFKEKIDINAINKALKSGAAIIAPDIISDNKHINPVELHSLAYNLYWQYLPILKRSKAKDYTFSGCFFFVSKETYKRVGGFDDGTFLYFEEYIMAYKIREIGEKIIFNQNIVVIHNHDYMELDIEKAVRLRNEFFKSGLYYEKKYNNIGPFKEKLYILSYNVTMILFRPIRKLYSFMNFRGMR